MGEGTQLIRGCLIQKVGWATGAASPGIWESVWNMHLGVICSKGRGGRGIHPPGQSACEGGLWGRCDPPALSASWDSADSDARERPPMLASLVGMVASERLLEERLCGRTVHPLELLGGGQTGAGQKLPHQERITGTVLFREISAGL